jgi:hypothetical protein
MPVIFLHGVNTRRGTDYDIDVAARRKIIKRLLIEPLGSHNHRFSSMKVFSPYWGDLGASFRWNKESFPKLSILATLGSESEQAKNDPIDFIEALEDMVLRPSESILQGRTEIPPGTLRHAANSDPLRFVEAVLLPVIRSEHTPFPPAVTSEDRGLVEAHLLIAADEASSDLTVRASVAAAQNDGEVLRVLRQAILRKYIELFRSASSDGAPTVQTLGPPSYADLIDYVGELFQRVEQAPKRTLTYSMVRARRRRVHDRLSLVLGDILVYLKDRGTPRCPGPIIVKVLKCLKSAIDTAPTEPVVVITHSMGGNIFYDIITAFEQDLRVDFWFSVAGQVGQFEEMKLFLASDLGVVSPQSVASLAPRVAHWHNIYDPADVLSFLVKPVFSGAQDHQYITGSQVLTAHGDYFRRPSFYRLLRSIMEKDLLSQTGPT